MFRQHFYCLTFIFLPLLLAGQSRPAEFANLKSDEFVVEYIAHACFRIHTSDKTIMIDPYADKIWIGYDFPKGITADAVFITHPHYDHDGGIHLGHRPGWLGKAPFVMIPDDYKVGDIQVDGYVGKHAAPYGKEFKAMNNVWVFQVKGVTIAHVGDNGPLTDSLASQLPPIDILMLPIDTHQHILQNDELSHWIARTGAKVILPMHYRIDDLEPVEGKPSSLGPVDYDFMNKSKVREIKSNHIRLSKTALPRELTYIVLAHYEIK